MPLRPGTLAAWGPAGHYYTVYYVLLAAGLGDDNARRMAFFTQLSDQVYELDAVSVAGDMINAISDQAPGDVDHSPGAALERARGIQNVFDVQAGLHCLTGRGSRKETAARAHVVLGCKVESDIGLALHPFGDSFAHRQLDDVKTMYRWKFGHAFDGHKADKIYELPGCIMTMLENCTILPVRTGPPQIGASDWSNFSPRWE